MRNLLKISDAASLALHAMTQLASKNSHKPQPVPIKEVSESLQVSEAYLSKIFQRLVREGLVEAHRGPNGGVMLATPPNKISLLDVYEAMDGPLTLSNCLLKNQVCDGSNCILCGLLESVNLQVKSYFKKTTLSQFAASPDGKKAKKRKGTSR